MHIRQEGSSHAIQGDINGLGMHTEPRNESS